MDEPLLILLYGAAPSLSGVAAAQGDTDQIPDELRVIQTGKPDR
jgi:hypothetical protein